MRTIRSGMPLLEKLSVMISFLQTFGQLELTTCRNDIHLAHGQISPLLAFSVSRARCLSDELAETASNKS